MPKSRQRRGCGIVICALVAAVMAAPGLLLAYTTLGGSLGVSTSGNGWQRDLRVLNNAQDPASNNNVTPEAAYPGALGAPLALWKAARAWASDTAGAGKNFEFDWQGVTTALPDGNANIISFDASACSGGVLAYCETPISDGWNIVMCDNWTWSDGPGNPPGGQFDIQGVAAHELGHALGLGHSASSCGSCSAAATMCPSICSAGVSERTISPDDAAGLETIYGTIPAGKPVITGLSGSLTTFQTLNIVGANFPASVNVKFTAGTGQNVGAIAGLVTGVPTTGGGTQVSVTIPQAANDGNVVVWDPATGLVSNAFPIDVDFIPPPPPPVPQIASIAPGVVTAYLGGPVTLQGTGFSGATQVSVGGVSLVPPFGFTVTGDTTITFGAPVPASLGLVPVVVTTQGGVSAPALLTYSETLPPKVTCPVIAVGGTTFTWTCGAGANDVAVIIASTDPTTFDFGTASQFLLNFQVVTQGVASQVGVAVLGIPFPAGLAGVVFHSQLAAVDDVSGAIFGSNVVTTTVIY